MDSYDLREAECPICGYHFDQATSIHDPVTGPRAGSLAICLACGELLEFTEHLQLVSLPEAHYATIAAQTPEAWRTLMAAQQLIREGLKGAQ